MVIKRVIVELILVCLTRVIAGQGGQSCSPLEDSERPLTRNDTVWSTYMDSVYGVERPQVAKEGINFLYKSSPVQIRAIDWGHKRPLSALKELWGDTYFHYSNKVYADNEWAEVTRYSTHYLNQYKIRDMVWEEGYSRGFPGRSPHNETKVSYGCWFNLAKGSGIFVNVGKTLVTPDKYHSTLFRDLGLTSRGCLQTDQTGDSCYDRYICTAALQQGYDSVQVVSHSEMIICSGKCATETLKYTCPPVELRSGFYAQGGCNCSDNNPVLNCGDGEQDHPRITNRFSSDHIEPAEGVGEGYNWSHPQRRSTCIARATPSPTHHTLFNITILFTAGILSHHDALPRVRAAVSPFAHHSNAVLVDVGRMVTLSTGDVHNITTDVAPPSQLRRLQPARAPPRKSTNERRHLRDNYHHRHSHGESEHSTPPPPPQFDRERDAPAGEHHHHRHHEGHDHHSHKDNHPASGSSITAPELTDLLKEVGYRALGLDSAVTPVHSTSSLPVLSGGHDGLHSATLTKVGDVKVGLVAYDPLPESTGGVTVNTSIEKIIDEAQCMRYLGASVVVLMTAEGLQSDSAIVRGTQEHIDVFITANDGPGTSCQGNWHTAPNSKPVFVQFNRNMSQIAVVRVSQSPTGIAYSSELLDM